jgi:hypothetical protein
MTRTARPRNDRVGLIPPGEMFDRLLPDRLILDVDLPFDERVERAWARLKLTRFAPDEYERLRTAMAEMLKEKHTLKDQIDE